MKTLAIILARVLIAVVTVFALYSYYPFASRVLSFLFHGGMLNGSRTSDSVLESFVEKSGVYDTFGIFFGILATLLVFIVPPGMILLLAWKIGKKVRFGRKKVHERPGLPGVDHFPGRVGGMGSDFSSRPAMSKDDLLSPHTRPGGAQKASAVPNSWTAGSENEVPSPGKGREEASGPGEGPDDLGEWLKKGRISYASGDYEAAVRAYSKAIGLEAGGSAYFNRAIAYLKMQQHQKALRDLKEAAELGHGRSQEILKSRGISW